MPTPGAKSPKVCRETEISQIHHLELLPDNGDRDEIIDGKLFVT